MPEKRREVVIKEQSFYYDNLCFMLNVEKSDNVILNSIVHCDIVHVSSWKHWSQLLYTRSSPVGNSTFKLSTLWCIFVLYNFLSCNLDVLYPQYSD